MTRLIQPWYNGVPTFLAQKTRWIVWKAVERVKDDGTKKIDKVPYSAKTGIKGGIDRPDDWVTLDQAFETYVLQGYSGVGYVFDADDGLFAIDLDKSLVDGQITPFAETILNTLKTYTEVSVSGTGLHIIGVGKLPGKGRVDHQRGIECYDTGRFFTITGKVFGGFSEVEHRVEEIRTVYESCWGKESTKEVRADDLQWNDAAVITPLENLPVSVATKELIEHGTGLDHYGGDRSNAIYHVCHELVVAGVNPETIMTILTDERYVLASAALDRRSGNVRSAREWLWKYSVGVVIKKVKQDQAAFDDADEEEEEDWKPKQNIPFEKANHERNALLIQNHVMPLVRINGGYLGYTGKCWRPITTEAVEGMVHRAMWGRGFPVSAINNTLTTLRRLAVKEHFTPSRHIINLQNGAISLRGWETGTLDLTLLPHDKRHHAIGVLPFDYDPNATCPTFVKFLKDVTQDDKQSISGLLEFMGLCLIPGELKFQKALYAVGVTGSGKSTFIKVFQALLGHENTVGLSFHDLTGEHGLTACEHAKLIIIPDAHQVDSTKINKVKQTLLNITSGDPVTINPKGKDQYTVTIPARIVMAANEPPRFNDEYGALMRRYLIIHFTKSFVGSEDVNLVDKLIAELPGIFNLVLHHMVVLGMRGHFIEPKRSQTKRDEIHIVQRSLNYFTENFVIQTKNENDRVEKSVLYDHYLQFSHEAGNRPIDIKRFSRRLKDEIPGLKEGRTLSEFGRSKAWIGIKIDSQKLADFDPN